MKRSAYPSDPSDRERQLPEPCCQRPNRAGGPSHILGVRSSTPSDTRPALGTVGVACGRLRVARQVRALLSSIDSRRRPLGKQAKKVKGRKRRIVVDTLRPLPAVAVCRRCTVSGRRWVGAVPAVGPVHRICRLYKRQEGCSRGGKGAWFWGRVIHSLGSDPGAGARIRRSHAYPVSQKCHCERSAAIPCPDRSFFQSTSSPRRQALPDARRVRIGGRALGSGAPPRLPGLYYR